MPNVPASNRILIADDEPDVLNLVSMNLKAAGFQVLTASDGPTALALARRDSPALVVLDIMMPGMSGIDVCRELKRTAEVAVLLLSARAEEVDRILAFELGADDYLVKPFSPRELVLRVKAILRRQQFPAEAPPQMKAGRIEIDRPRHTVLIDGAPIQVTAIEYRLLCTFMERTGHVLSREDLLAKVWPADTEIDLRTVDTHMRRLRERLGAAGEQLQTVRGFGYRMQG